MMSQTGEITDDLLQDFVDGRLEPQARATLLSRLEQDPARLRYVLETIETDKRLRDMADAALFEDVPDRLLAIVRNAREEHTDDPDPDVLPAAATTTRSWPVMTGIAAVLVGIAIGWTIATYDLPGNEQIDLALGDATSAFSFYLQDPDYPIDFGYDRINEFLPRTEAALGRQVDPPDLSASGFSLAGGRVIPGPRGNAIMYLYQRGDGEALERMAVYVWRPGENGDDLPDMQSSPDIRTAQWETDGLRYAMLGGANQPDFNDIELDMRSRFNAMGMSHDTSQ